MEFVLRYHIFGNIVTKIECIQIILHLLAPTLFVLLAMCHYDQSKFSENIEPVIWEMAYGSPTIK